MQVFFLRSFFEAEYFLMKHFLQSLKHWTACIGSGFVTLSLFAFIISPEAISSALTPIIKPMQENYAIPKKPTYEVLGFAPYWTIKKLHNIDYETLTTLAYFSLPLEANGTFKTQSPGYTTLFSPEAQAAFVKTHEHGKKVIATISILDNPTIEQFLSNPSAQREAIEQSKHMMKAFAFDGFNIDIEYVGKPSSTLQTQFSSFVAQFNDEIHKLNPNAYISVSVYASAVKEFKLYDIAALAKSTDGIFMMAYDFATTGAQVAMPTAPLYGYKEGKYWYDVSTAVEDFLKVMPAEKLVLGVPYYGYNYAVTTPGEKALTIRNRYTRSFAQTYTSTVRDIDPSDETTYMSGFDEVGRVGWKAYKEGKNYWRMVYTEDVTSLNEKYQFAKNKSLAGVGIWALGFDSDRSELWDLLRTAFGPSLASK